MFNKYLQHPLHTPPTPSDSISGGEPTPCIWWSLSQHPARHKVSTETTVLFFNKEKNSLVPFYRRPVPQDTREKRPWAPFT